MANFDPVVLAAEARGVLQKVHGRNDVVVEFRSNKSGFDSDALSELDFEAPGHFRPDEIRLRLNLDELVPANKEMPRTLATIEDFRKYPVLAGVAAHESGHAKYSLWGTSFGNPLPESLPNPAFDATHVHDDDCAELCTESIENFPIADEGKLKALADLLEEPRIERLGVKGFTKTWRMAMQFSAAHFVLERIGEDDQNQENPLDAALNMAILVGGRFTAGTLGVTHESRKSVQTILASAQKVIEESLPDAKDPYHAIMGIINGHVFNNDHEDPVPHLEAARRILEIIHPEDKQDPDAGPQAGKGEGEGAEGGASAMSAAVREAMQEMRDAIDAISDEMVPERIRDEDAPEKKNDRSTGHGAVRYNNPKAPQVDHHEEPTATDRELYRRAREWMEQQIEPSVTERESGQWLPVGGARLDVRAMVRDNLAGHRGTQRSDWNKLTQTIKPTPPVKVAIMLDGSGSMGSMARPSASIAWAAANASADLPESRTVSVVYGAAAGVTQAPGHVPARTIAVSRTDGPWENFIEAAGLVEEALWLNEEVSEDEKSNVLVIIVSDLRYGRGGQMEGFYRITKDWSDRGYQILVVGAQPEANAYGQVDGKTVKQKDIPGITIVTPEELFR